MKKQACVYLIVCLKTGEKYVGSTNYLNRRFQQHKFWMRRGLHHNHKLQNVWDTYGEDAFQLSVLEKVEDPNILYKREQFWIDTIQPELNITTIVTAFTLGLKRSPKTIEKLSKIRKEYHDRLTPEQKIKLRENIKNGINREWNSLNDEEKKEHIKNISHPHTEEAKRKMGDKSRKNSARFWQGKSRSPETIEKMRTAKQQEWDRSKVEREQEKARKLSEFEAGREQREKERVEKIRNANTGKTLSQEQRDHLREVALAQQQDPEYREKHRAGVIKAMQDPEVLQRLSESHKGRKMPEEQKEKIRASQQGKPKSDEIKKKMSEGQKERWKQKKSNTNQ